MKLSIIMVCLNAAKNIERTFVSILEQSYKDIELIVYDGLSSDGTLDVIEKYKDKINYFHSGKDGGIYNAMNLALNKATGDYLLFFNAGDEFCNKDVLTEAINRIQNAGLADVAFGWANYVDEGGSQNTMQKYSDWGEKYFFAKNNICHQAIFYKKSLFYNDCYNENLKIYADWDFNARCFCEKKASFYPLDFPVCNFYLGGISTDRKNSHIFRKEIDIIQRRYFKKIYPFIAADKFLVKNFNSIYSPIKNLFIKRG